MIYYRVYYYILYSLALYYRKDTIYFQLSNKPATGEVDVRFVLLEKPNLSGPVFSSRPQLLMADAYKTLHDNIFKHNASVKLDLSPTKKLVSYKNIFVNLFFSFYTIFLGGYIPRAFVSSLSFSFSTKLLDKNVLVSCWWRCSSLRRSPSVLSGGTVPWDGPFPPRVLHCPFFSLSI